MIRAADMAHRRVPLSTIPELPTELAELADLALDLHWTWSHETDTLWQQLDAETWRQTRNPWIILQDASPTRLSELAGDPRFVAELDRLAAHRRAELETPSWFAATDGRSRLGGVAYFSMEFGVGEALPLYAGGLGILAGDILKTASDLGIPMIGIGLLYQEGYFRQVIDASGWQQEAYPYNEPAMLPIQPARDRDGGWLHISLDLPGRTLLVRVWKAQMGRTALYLLDSNDPLNSPVDRGITAKLYGGGSEMRLMQEIVLGVAGWRVVEALHPETEVCHLNEGHAAFVVLERARLLARRSGLRFWEAFWATRGGNVFSTHTPVEAGFDRFDSDLIRKYLACTEGFAADTGTAVRDLLALGRVDANAENEPFNMAYLAVRGSALTLGVSRLHGAVSRRIFQPLFPRWPAVEVPIGHVTNAVHVPSWDSAEADKIWTAACGKGRWRATPDGLTAAIERVADDALWVMRGTSRQKLVQSVQNRLKMHLGGRGYPAKVVALAESVLDANVLTLGFARRFTGYKRPNLLLRDPPRLARLLNNDHRPVQLVIAGKAHPDDGEGKNMVRDWVAFAQRPDCRRRVVFLEDYDIALAQELVQGVDVWINTPRRPWEACGTSGMKVLVNGGLNLSVLDGWWAEAYAPGLGWAIGDEAEQEEGAHDQADAEELYAVLEDEVVPEFYDRDALGVPRAWLSRVRRSMATLTPAYAGTRLVDEYLSKAYLPAAEAVRQRLAEGAQAARNIAAWEGRIRSCWETLHLGDPQVVQDGDFWEFSVPVYLGEMAADDIRVELYADPVDGGAPETVSLDHEQPIVGAANGYIYVGRVPMSRPAEHFTARVRPYHPSVRVPAEMPLILWQR
jgi:glycogen phosphorylase